MSDYPYQYEITIDGMVCQSCATRVENAFHAKDGFAAKVDLPEKMCVGGEQNREVTEEFLRATVKEAGYTALKIYSKTKCLRCYPQNQFLPNRNVFFDDYITVLYR